MARRKTAKAAKGAVDANGRAVKPGDVVLARVRNTWCGDSPRYVTERLVVIEAKPILHEGYITAYGMDLEGFWWQPSQFELKYGTFTVLDMTPEMERRRFESLIERANEEKDIPSAFARAAYDELDARIKRDLSAGIRYND